MKRLALVLVFVIVTTIPTVSTAVMITPDFSKLGTIKQPDGTDVTSLVKENVNAAIQWWENAILKDFPLMIEFTFASLTGDVGLHTLVMEDATTKFIEQSKIQFDLTTETDWFFDDTPHDNSEFDIKTFKDTNGVVVGIEGAAVAGKGATDKWDFLAVAKHEIGHALGLSVDGTLYNAERGDGDIDIDAGLMSTLASIPVTGSHFDGNALMELFDHALMASPGFKAGERALQSQADILAIASVYDLSKDEINLNPSHVPEPSSILLFAMAIPFLLFCRHRQSQRRPQ